MFYALSLKKESYKIGDKFFHEVGKTATFISTP
jgi:hypothetical protein